MTRADIRIRVRDYIYEPVAKLISEAQLNRLFSEELNSLPVKLMGFQEIWMTPIVANQQDYSLPTGTVYVEYVEINYNNQTPAYWTELLGCQKYAGSLFLPYVPSSGNDMMRVWIKRPYTATTDDTTNLDIPDPESEVLVWGMVIRAYKMLIGYMRFSKNFDSVTAPSGVTMVTLQGYLRDAQKEYKDLLGQYSTQQRPHNIDLVG